MILILIGLLELLFLIIYTLSFSLLSLLSLSLFNLDFLLEFLLLLSLKYCLWYLLGLI